MGEQISYIPVPRSPNETEKNRMLGRRKNVIIVCSIAVPWILFTIVLGLYLSLLYSDPVARLEGCQSELLNQTSSSRAAIASLQQRLEALEQKEKAARAEGQGLQTELGKCRSELQNQTSSSRAAIASLRQRVEALEQKEKASAAEGQGLRTQLAATNRSLLETRGHWEACQSQLKTVEQNLRARVTEAKRQEMKKCEDRTAELQQQLSEKARDLEDARHRSQQQREECEAQIREMWHNDLPASTGTSAGVLVGPVTALLLVALPASFQLL